jgi:plasmid stability protein
MAAMATLHLRNVPDDLDALLTQDAAARGQSKNRRAVELLRRALGVDQVERARLVAEIRRDRRRVDVDIAAVVRGERPDDDD